MPVNVAKNYTTNKFPLQPIQTPLDPQSNLGVVHLALAQAATAVDRHDHSAGNGLRISSIPTVINVKDAAYGAKGDGVTDDTAAIQAANDAGTGIIDFPPGTYISAGNVFDSFRMYQGAGVDATILQLKAGIHAPVLKSRNFDALTGGGTNGGAHHFAIRDMTIFGDKLNNLGDNVPLIEIYGYAYLLDNLRVYYGRSESIYSEWGITTSMPSGVGTCPPGALWNNVVAHDSDCQGYTTGVIDFRGPHDSQWNNVTQDVSLSDGIYVGVNGAGLLATNCHAFGSNAGYSWHIDAGACFLTNCYGEGGTTAQLLINASDTEVLGGIYHNGSVATASAVGIVIGGAAANCRIDTKVMRCLAGALSFASSGGNNRVDLVVTQASGAVVTGTPNATDRVRVMLSGGATNYLMSNQGTATIASATTSIVVNHGLSVTPTLNNISITQTNNPTNTVKYWISTPTATQFTINASSDPGASGATFVWTAVVL